MAEEESPVMARVVIDPDGYLRVELPPIDEPRARDLVVGFLDTIDPAMLGDVVLREFVDVDPMTGALAALKRLAEALTDGD